MWLHSSVGRASHRYRGGQGFESRWSPDLFQASSFQLLKLENLLRWSHFTFIFIYYSAYKALYLWVTHFCEWRANKKQQRPDPWQGCLLCNRLLYPRFLTLFIERLQFFLITWLMKTENCWFSVSRHADGKVGGPVASWLVRSTPERAVWVRALAGTLCCVLGQDTFLSQCLSPPRCKNRYRHIVGETWQIAGKWHAMD